MQFTVEDFVGRYQASGLASAKDKPSIMVLFADFASKFAVSSDPVDPVAFAKWLVSQDFLTPFQARVLLETEHSRLAFDGYELRRKLDSGYFAGWFVAHNVDGKRFLLNILPAQLSQSAAENLRNMERLADSNVVPVFAGVGGTDSSKEPTYLLLELPSGVPATKFAESGHIGQRQATLIAIDLAKGLESLHRAGTLWCPRTIDQVWFRKDGAAMLICDPLAMGAIVGAAFQDASVVDQRHRDADRDLIAMRYRAPELFLPNTAPDPATDIYAFGCIIYELLFGEALFNANVKADFVRAHQTQTPKHLSSAAKVESSPLHRVLAHCLAKNRKARFTSAADLSRALLAALATFSETSSSSPTQKPAPSKNPVVTAPPSMTPTQPTTPPATQPPPAPPKQSSPSASEPPRQAPASINPMVAASTEAIPTPAPQKAMTASTPTTDDAKKTASRDGVRRKRGKKLRKKKSLLAPLVLGVLGFVLMILVVLLLIRGNSGSRIASNTQTGGRTLPAPTSEFKGSAERTARESTTANTLTNENPTAAQSKPSAYDLVDDQRVLWADPKPGVAPTLALVPPGCPMVVSINPQAFVKGRAGANLIDALQPEVGESWTRLFSWIGTPVEGVSRLTFGLRGIDGGQVTGSVVVELKQPQRITEFVDKLNLTAANSDGRSEKDAKIYVSNNSNNTAYYLQSSSSESDRQTVVRYMVGTLDEVVEVDEVGGAPMSLPPNLNDLWQSVGSDPDLALLSTANFPFADGRGMLLVYAEELFKPLQQFLVPDTSGFVVRMDFEPLWFAELRLAPGGGTSPAALKNKLDTRIANLPEIAEQFRLNANPHETWRPLAFRLPDMMRALQRMTRTGFADKSVVANAYLPANAAPNMVLATMLAANTSAASQPQSTGSTTPTKQALTTIDQLLDSTMTILFNQESLEMASRTIEDQFNATTPTGSLPLKIKLIGSDLQLEGITQNQQIRNFDHAESTLRTVLDDLVRRANPDATATALSDEKQKLIWVVSDDPENPGKPVVFITVRSQAAKRGFQLPPQFSP